ncbi:interleukin-12 receptor subunit beta-2 [Austrofundulus limnaeus]|uniref:Interleukin-12 receptor subunit beta-2 n=1 Tax=Austrofundulus limnaeus TaxID=52670 RepID=A0A2I4CU14_AUSLI|nr:PREDICTED: interleukin-12 receptor subunit beta-2-like [Austrofundulus limnaeus]
MLLPWFIVLIFTLVDLQICVAENSCTFWSSAGSVVQHGSSFTVYCMFNCKCKGSMYSDGPDTPLSPKQLNSTTIYLNVEGITEKRTYGCRCNNHEPKPLCLSQDPCGLDISPGYPPDHPKNISCVYEISNNETGVVNCVWDRGRDTYLQDHFVMWMRAGNHTETHVLHESSKGTENLSANFTLSTSVQYILVWVRAQNVLGSVESSIVNYTVSDIVMPSTPVLAQPECSSRNCSIRLRQFDVTQTLQIQFRTEQQQQWTTHPDSVVSMNSSVNIWSLEPYRLYHFRARSKFSTGLWSPWSSKLSSWTQEEAPAHALDVWFAPGPAFESMKIYWKESELSISKGRNVEYKITVYSRNLSFSINVSADVKSWSVPFCANCEVTVQARNSKGLSPPAKITTHQRKAETLLDVRAKSINSTVAISWTKPETAATAYVVEWFPEGLMLEELRWVRLDQNHTRVVLTDLKPWECYEGAVNAFSNDSLISRSRFKQTATLESVPETGPSVEKQVKGDEVTVTWMELPRLQRRGCITRYTIYLENHENNPAHPKLFSVGASHRKHMIRGLSPALYSLWMSASTAEGEGPPGQKIKFYIEEDNQLYPLLMIVFAVSMISFVFCLWKSSFVKQRFRQFFSCLIPDVPDPANSKWAKQCTKDGGKMILQLQPGNSNLINEEDETILVNVEIFKQRCDTYTPTNISPCVPSPTNLSPETELTTLLYPALTTYIKSFSHDSDSSDHTQTSLDTNTTISYISFHGMGNLDSYDQEEEEEEPVHFFPSLNIFMEPLELGEKLTLDAVKIDCSDFFQNA